MKQIEVMIKEPNKEFFKKLINNDLKELQGIVGGYIETVTLPSEYEAVVICDEEGFIKDSKFNVAFNGIQFFGTIIIAGVDGENLCDVPECFDSLLEVNNKTNLRM